MVNATKLKRVINIEKYKIRRLSDLKLRYAEIANVSGKGPIMSLELLQSQPSLNVAYIQDIVELCKHRGIAVERCGKDKNILNIYQRAATIQDVDCVINVLEKTLQDIIGNGAKDEYVFINGI